MILFTYTNQVYELISRFKQSKEEEHEAQENLRLYEKVDLCPYELHIISQIDNTRGFLQNAKISSETILMLKNAWCNLLKGHIQSEDTWNKAYQDIERLGERCGIKSEFYSFFLRRYNKDPSNITYFLLLDFDSHPYMLKLYYRSLCNIWQVDIGHIPLHASAVNFDDKLFLFSGPSRIGKSTISKILESLGGDVLDEDQVMIRKIRGGYTANAWGYSLKTARNPIHGIFKLVQNDRDALKTIPQEKMARFIYEQSMEVTGGFLPDDLHLDLFGRICQLVRDVPCYELHFRKSPEFWRLIKEELHV